MRNLFIAGVATVDIFAGDQLFATAKTLIDSSITIGVSEQEVRGGMGNKLYGKYFHTSKFDAKLTDSMFKLEYLAKNVGSDITVGSNLFTEEEITLGGGGAGTVVGTPIAVDSYGVIGWATVAGQSEWQKVIFTGSAFTFIGGTSGDKVCVKYVAEDTAGRQIIVSANIIPSTVKLVMKAQLFAGDNSDPDQATRAGFVQIEVPRFQLAGNQEIAMTSSGVSNTPLTGSALAIPSNSCSVDDYYAIISEFVTSAHWYDDCYALSVAGGSVDIVVSGSETLIVYALHTNAAPSIAPNSDLTFSSSDPLIATAGIHTGIISGISDGTTIISASITAKPAIEAFVEVNVTT